MLSEKKKYNEKIREIILDVFKRYKIIKISSVFCTANQNRDVGDKDVSNFFS